MNLETIREPELDVRKRDRVVIAAAVNAFFGRPVAIRRITALPPHRDGAWIREGRLAIQRSHRTSTTLGRSDCRGI
jgi:hypothetical protein